MTVFLQNSAIENALSTAKYAMYLRKSRADLELEAISKEETLARHKAMLYALAERNGIAPSQITIYHEIVSGESLDDRPEALRLLADVYKGKYAGVLVAEIERLARGNTKDQGEVAEAFQMSSTLIITPAKVYDPNDEFDQEYFEFGLFMSRREYKTIRRRLIAGKLLAAKEGNYLLPYPPFGYDVVRKSKKDRYLVENPETAKYVRMMFDWYTEDRRATSWIAKQFTLMGLKTPKGSANWSRATIADMLRNPVYIGKIVWGKTSTVKRKDPETGKLISTRISNDSDYIFEGKHKGLISEEQFKKVFEIYGTNAPLKQNAVMINPLATLLRCHKCGKGLNCHPYPDNRVTRIIHPRQYVESCQVKSVALDDVIQAVSDGLTAYIDNYQIKIDNGTENEAAKRQKETIAAMQAELKKLETKKRRLFDSWESDDGMYTQAEFVERKQMYAASIESMQQQITALERTTPVEVDYQQEIINLHAMIKCLRNKKISAEEKNIFLKRFIDSISVETIDLGNRRGAKIILDIRLK